MRSLGVYVVLIRVLELNYARMIFKNILFLPKFVGHIFLYYSIGGNTGGYKFTAVGLEYMNFSKLIRECHNY